jgi:hypothetical protein
MSYAYELKTDDNIGLVIVEYFKNKPICIWELKTISKNYSFSKELKKIKVKEDILIRQDINRVLKWLIKNHIELLI